MSDPGMMETVASTQDMHERMQAAAAATGPSFFKLRARLPTQGRADTLMAARCRPMSTMGARQPVLRSNVPRCAPLASITRSRTKPVGGRCAAAA